jgi:hypothetical protein
MWYRDGTLDLMANALQELKQRDMHALSNVEVHQLMAEAAEDGWENC